ncbi:MAG: DUF814 domain-containing protein [Candidatus Marinimicrobia bacterium]|nr:DUF814 domain-containing protein [Candidatus Neomarinimicrobiota bacterium]
MNTQIKGAKVIQAYTFRKGRLDIHLAKGNQTFRLSWEKKGNQAWLTFSPEPSLPKKRVQVLKKLPGDRSVTCVRLLSDDRLLRIDFDNEHSIIFGFYPEALNVYSFKEDTFIESFLKQDKPIQLSGNWLDPQNPIPDLIPGQNISRSDLIAASKGLSVEADTGALLYGLHDDKPSLNISELMIEMLRLRQKPKLASSVSVEKIAKTVLKRWKSKLSKIEQELVEANKWPELKLSMEGLQIAQAMRLPINDHEISLSAELSPTGEPMHLILEPGKNLVQLIEATAKKIRKFRGKLEQLQEILHQIRADIHLLEQALTGADLNVLQLFLQSHGEALDSKGQQQSERKPYKKYLSPSGFEILVGRSSSDNDTLTFRLANKNDWWFHARQVRGTHVVLRTGTRTPQRIDIIAAAEHAARNSKAKHSGIVVVQYCQRKHLSKPKGSHSGSVLVHNEQSITITLD